MTAVPVRAAAPRPSGKMRPSPTGGERNAVWRFSATNRPKKSGSMLNCVSSGRKIGRKMMISVHSSGQPRKKMMTYAMSVNCTDVMSSDFTHTLMISWPPRIANAPAKMPDPTNSQHTMAEVFAVRKTAPLSIVMLNRP